VRALGAQTTELVGHFHKAVGGRSLHWPDLRKQRKVQVGSIEIGTALRTTRFVALGIGEVERNNLASWQVPIAVTWSGACLERQRACRSEWLAVRLTERNINADCGRATIVEPTNRAMTRGHEAAGWAKSILERMTAASRLKRDVVRGRPDVRFVSLVDLQEWFSRWCDASSRDVPALLEGPFRTCSVTVEERQQRRRIQKSPHQAILRRA
jgi:hypothetical protein